jgi:hypothetical protein
LINSTRFASSVTKAEAATTMLFAGGAAGS